MNAIIASGRDFTDFALLTRKAIMIKTNAMNRHTKGATAKQVVKYLQGQSRAHLKIGPYQPVAITEEWLRKVGFKQQGEAFVNVGLPYWVHDCVCLFYNEADITISKNDSCLMSWLGGYGFTWLGTYYAATFKWICHVHELQNLYFVLTGKELKYDN